MTSMDTTSVRAGSPEATASDHADVNCRRAASPSAIRHAMSPIDGSRRVVKVAMPHSQFAGDIVTEVQTGIQFVDPSPTTKDLAHLYGVVYNKAYGRDLSANATVPSFVTRRANAQLKFIQSHLPAQIECAHIVEVGGGWGALSSALMGAGSPFSHNVVCYELDSHAVEFMKSRGICARKGSLEAAPLAEVAESSVDLIVSSMMLEHLPSPRDALQAWGRRLKAGGHIFVEVPLENPVPTWWGTDPSEPYWVGHVTFFARGHVDALLDSAGFDVIASLPFDHCVAPNFVNKGDAPYCVESVPVSLDSTPSELGQPRLVRILARKRG